MMPTHAGGGSISWYRSFYFRIGFTFVAFVVGLLLLQALVFNALNRGPLRGSPNTVVALVAADLTAALTENRQLDVDAYLKSQFARSQPIYVVMTDGETASNRSVPLPDLMRDYVIRVMRGNAPDVRIESAGPAPF